MPEPRPEVSRPARFVMVFSVVALLLSIWPIYPLASRIYPMVLGLPFSLFYLVALVLTVFSVMLGLFLWESRNDRLG